MSSSEIVDTSVFRGCIGSLIRAAHALHVHDDVTCREIARLLGIGHQKIRQSVALNDPTETNDKHSPASDSSPRNDKATNVKESTGPAPAGEITPIQVTPIQVKRPPEPEWLKSSTPLPRGKKEVPPARRPPLLDPACDRSILLELCAVSRLTDDVDLTSVEAALVRSEPITDIPMLRRKSWPDGIVVLSDRRLGTAAHWPDHEDFLTLARRWLPKDDVIDLHFSGIPDEQEFWAFWLAHFGRDATAWKAVCVVLTDFSIGGGTRDPDRVSSSGWLKFSRALLQHQIRHEFLVSYQPKRWPKSLRTLPHAHHWRRGLGLPQLRQAFLRTER